MFGDHDEPRYLRVDVHHSLAPNTTTRLAAIIERYFGGWQKSYLEAEDLRLDVLERTAVDLDKTLASLKQTSKVSI